VKLGKLAWPANQDAHLPTPTPRVRILGVQLGGGEAVPAGCWPGSVIARPMAADAVSNSWGTRRRIGSMNAIPEVPLPPLLRYGGYGGLWGSHFKKPLSPRHKSAREFSTKTGFSMGLRGRKTTPIQLKILKNNPGREPLKRMAANMPPSPGDSAEPPPELAGVALEKWRASVPLLQSMRVWSEDAATTWSRYCRTFALWMEAQTYIERNGQVYETASGLCKARPETILCRGYAADLLRIEQSFGLVPSAKSSVTIQSRAEDDLMDKFLREA